MQVLSSRERIAQIRTPADEEELIDELVDRFGDIPKETMNLLKIAQIRGLCEELSVRRVYEQNKRILFTFAEKNRLTPYAVVCINDAWKGRAFVHGGVPPYIRIPMIETRKLGDCLRLLRLIRDSEAPKGGN